MQHRLSARNTTTVYIFFSSVDTIVLCLGDQVGTQKCVFTFDKCDHYVQSVKLCCLFSHFCCSIYTLLFFLLLIVSCQKPITDSNRLLFLLILQSCASIWTTVKSWCVFLSLESSGILSSHSKHGRKDTSLCKYQAGSVSKEALFWSHQNQALTSGKLHSLLNILAGE
jgi:hypothetical protein